MDDGGIVQSMVSDTILVLVPIVTGAVKLPNASESCAVKILPVVNTGLLTV